MVSSTSLLVCLPCYRFHLPLIKLRGHISAPRRVGSRRAYPKRHENQHMPRDRVAYPPRSQFRSQFISPHSSGSGCVTSFIAKILGPSVRASFIMTSPRTQSNSCFDSVPLHRHKSICLPVYPCHWHTKQGTSMTNVLIIIPCPHSLA